MADETEDPKRNFRLIPGTEGKVKVLLSKRASQEAEGEGPDDGEEDDEQSGGIMPSTSEEDELIPPRRNTIQVFDLATRFEAHGINEYTNLDYVAGMARTNELDPLTFLHLHPDDTDLTALDRALLGRLAPDPANDYDPLGKSPTVGGHSKVSNTLLLNHKSDIDPVVYDLQGLTLWADDGTQIPVQLESEWKWKGTNLATAGWASSNTEIHAAPASGKFVRKGRKRKFVSIGWDDFRYHATYTHDARWKVTERASFDSPAAPLAVKFPLRIYAVPSLYSATEATAGAAMVGIGSPQSAVALVSINEYGVNAGVRIPAIPGPFSDLLQPQYDADPARHLLVKREVFYFWPGQPRVEEVTYFEGRRPFPNEVLWAEALEYGEARYHRTEPDGLDWFPLSFVSPGSPYSFNAHHVQRAGHLTAVIVCKRKVYYVWRAV